MSWSYLHAKFGVNPWRWLLVRLSQGVYLCIYFIHEFMDFETYQVVILPRAHSSVSSFPIVCYVFQCSVVWHWSRGFRSWRCASHATVLGSIPNSSSLVSDWPLFFSVCPPYPYCFYHKWPSFFIMCHLRKVPQSSQHQIWSIGPHLR